ncbi:hypothetical protein VNI00_012824 [Paramarasmius palmivorus]|uniref:Uncharacterized protein n=1 Tax=Paramarasmius palmivorus TaxID=297713 RepID=A0AAW0C3Q9_9AGAR
MHFAAFIALALGIATVSAAPSAHQLEARKNVDRPDPTNLDYCPGRPIGDADRCTFEKQANLPDRRRWFILGVPVANCDKPNAPAIQTTVGGERTVSQSWGHSNKAEIDLAGIKIGGEGGWEESQSRTERQLITVTIPAGKQRAVVAGVLYHEQSGRIRLNYPDPTGESGKNDYHYIWYNNGIISSQPTDDVEYDSVEISCGEKFDLSRL